MRVISGTARGRRLVAPDGPATRPTPDRVREATFNALGSLDAVVGATVIDLFAGSGALGIEALSRGARSAVFVESAPGAAKVLRENVAASGLGERARVLAMPMTRAIRALAREGVTLDGVLADPPYGEGLVQQLLEAVLRAGVLAEDGWIAVEHETAEAPVPGPELTLVTSRRHGRTALTLLTRRTEVA